MSDNVVNFKQHQQKALHKKKEARIETIKNQFETALPLKKAPKEKLLSIFKQKKKNTRTPTIKK